MKNKYVELDSILEKFLKDDEVRVYFQRSRFHLQMAHLVEKLRKKSGMTQKELAERASVSQPMIARLEKGDLQRIPTFETIYRVLSALGYEMSFNVHKIKKKAA